MYHDSAVGAGAWLPPPCHPGENRLELLDYWPTVLIDIGGRLLWECVPAPTTS